MRMRGIRFLAWLPAACSIVALAGCGGNSGSPTNPTSCSYSLSSTSQALAGLGGTFTVSVSGSGSCSWTATAGNAWVHVTSGGSGSGPGSIAVKVDPNPDGSARQSTVHVQWSGGSQDVAVRQDAGGPMSCYSGSVTAQQVAAAGSLEMAIQLALQSACSSAAPTWTATTGANWIHIKTPNGSGNGTITYSVDPNPDSGARSDQVNVDWIVGGLQVAVNQQGTGGGTSCHYGISPTTQSVGAEGGNQSAQITADSGCAWSVSADSWIHFTSTASGTGSGTVYYSVDANPGSSTRTGAVHLLGGGSTQDLTITQAGSTPVSECYSLSVAVQQALSSGGNYSVQVNTSSGCSSAPPWSASSNAPWIQITSQHGVRASAAASAGAIDYTVQSNTSTSPRSGTISITWSGGRKDLTVNQDGVNQSSCTYTLSPTSASAPASGSGPNTVTLTINSACAGSPPAWSASPNVTWITATPTSATSFQYTVAVSTSQSTRTGTIDVTWGSGKAAVSISQSGQLRPCYNLVPPPSLPGYTNGTDSASLSLNTACGASVPWTASVDQTWSTLDPTTISGTTGGSINFSYVFNPVCASRSATLTVSWNGGSATATISQGPALCDKGGAGIETELVAPAPVAPGGRDRP